MPVVKVGTDDIDIITVTASELPGSTIDGKGGNDILELAGGLPFGTYDFRTVTLTSIERVRGIASSQELTFLSAQIHGISSFENPNASWFVLNIEGLDIDFRNKSLAGPVDIMIQTNNATFTVNDWDAALAVNGSSVVGETLIVENLTLTDSQRRTLHSHGIDRVMDATHVVSEDLLAPTISGLDNRIAIARNVQFHVAPQAVLTDDIGLSAMNVAFERWNDTLRIDQSGAVHIELDGWEQVIVVNGRTIGRLSSASGFVFNSDATVADVQEVLRSIVCISDDTPMPAWSNKLTIDLTDLGGHQTHVEIPIEYQNDAPTGLSLSNDVIDPYSMNLSIYVTDPNQYETFKYELLDDANGQFLINVGNYGASISLAKPLERQGSFTVKVRVTDHGGLSIDRTFTLHTDEGNSYIPDILDPDDTAPEPDDLNFQVIRGTNSAERLIGGDGDDRIIALQGNDTLSGKSGNDILFGGLGRDILTGGSGSDLFVFDSKVAKKNNTNVDTIRDFHVQDDRILLAKNVFSKIGKIGDLSKKSFWIGSHAHDADDRVIYNKKTGALYYDSDGTGHNAQIHIATLSKSLKMTYSDFYVI